MILLHKLSVKKVIRSFLRITFFYAALLLWISNGYTQTYHFDYYSVKEGLPQSKVHDVIQDNEGYIWLATESGVSRFDGKNFVNFTSENGLEPGGAKILMEDKQGNIWIGHKTGGITLYNKKQFVKHPICDIISSEISSFLMDKDTILWITSVEDGLIRLDNPYEIDPAKVRYEQYKGKRLSDRVFLVATAQGDSLFFITDAGIKKYNPQSNSFTNFSPDNLVHYFSFTTFLEDRKGNIWIGTYHGGLYKYIKETKTIKIYDARDGLADNWVTTLFEDSKGNIWAGSWGGGITKISENEIKVFDNSNGLRDLKIWKINEDIEGNILIASHESGLIIFKGERFITYGISDGLADEQVWAITRDKGNKYWFGTNKGITVLNFEAGKSGIRSAQFNQAKNNIGDHVRFLKADNNDNIWIGTTDNGIITYNYKAGRFNIDPIINRFVHNGVVTALDIDSQNQLWVGTLAGLIYHEIDNNKSNFLTQINGLNGTSISAIYADSKDRIWVGIDGKGLNLIIGATIKKIELEGAITPKCFVEDKEGNIWIGTQAKGILVCDGEKIIKRVTQNDGLLSNSISLINVDEKNHIYVGTSRGLNKIDENGIIHMYSERNGFTGIEAKENATFKDIDGNLWFGTVKGAVKYQTSLEAGTYREPITHISGFKVNLKNRKMEDGLKLRYTENSVLFEYNSISLDNPDAVSFQIMLEPAEQEWRPITQETTAIYSSLAPNKYTFKVKAKNSDGIWNKEPVTYSFIIKPPFYKTWWFIMAVVVLGVIAIISYIKVREKNLIKEKRILEEKVAERTAEVVQKSEEIEKKNKDITDSIRYAKRIQTAVLPPEIPFDNTFILFRPKDIVSGDFYWLETVGSLEMIAAVDCTGHGVPGAFLSILGHSLLTKIVKEYGILKPNEILNQLDIEIINALHQKNVEGERIVNDGMDLALICYNKDTNVLEYSGAYNPLIMVRNGELEEYKADRFPIGMTSVHGSKTFTNTEIQVQNGDTFYIFSDGYADQFGGGDGRKFRKKNMKDLLLSIQNKSMKEQGAELERFILDWMGDFDQIDDMVFIGRRF